MCFATIIISIVYIYLLQWIVKPLLYASMLCIFLCFAALALYGYVVAQDYEKDSDDWKMAMAGAIVFALIDFIYMIFVCCCWNNISLGASIMQAASQFVSSTKRIVAVPLLSYIIVIPIFCIW